MGNLGSKDLMLVSEELKGVLGDDVLGLIDGTAGNTELTCDVTFCFAANGTRPYSDADGKLTVSGKLVSFRALPLKTVLVLDKRDAFKSMAMADAQSLAILHGKDVVLKHGWKTRTSCEYIVLKNGDVILVVEEFRAP